MRRGAWDSAEAAALCLVVSCVLTVGQARGSGAPVIRCGHPSRVQESGLPRSPPGQSPGFTRRPSWSASVPLGAQPFHPFSNPRPSGLCLGQPSFQALDYLGLQPFNHPLHAPTTTTTTKSRCSSSERSDYAPAEFPDVPIQSDLDTSQARLLRETSTCTIPTTTTTTTTTTTRNSSYSSCRPPVLGPVSRSSLAVPPACSL